MRHATTDHNSVRFHIPTYPSSANQVAVECEELVHEVALIVGELHEKEEYRVLDIGILPNIL
jgi:hypothetical protein